MPRNQQGKGNMGTNMQSGTNPQKVKQQIQNDVANGQGAMTSREAGAMRD
ncbi:MULTISPECIES: hypothetical protein [unclassified Bacillus (in: firmicutes)]|nr:MULTISPECIES: hypothetical protein [unclassified Bacillus (in: firmicutes)]SFC69946.1 hypothetical protein SAMN02799633_01365 [Bacillus sp. UNCCL81]